MVWSSKISTSSAQVEGQSCGQAEAPIFFGRTSWFIGPSGEWFSRRARSERLKPAWFQRYHTYNRSETGGSIMQAAVMQATVMQAAVLGEKGVEVRDLPKPAPKPNEVLIRVRASSLNRADLLVAMGHQHGAVGGVGARLGLECSGEVEAVGSEVQAIKPGDRVMASAPGGFAEYVVTDAGRVHRIPGNNMSYENMSYE